MPTTLYALTLKGRERPMAQFRVVAYEPSTAEQRWHDAIRTHNPITCRPWHLGGALGSLVDAERQELERPAPSHVLFAHNEDHHSQFRVAIEPLVNSLRHPHLQLPGNRTIATLMDPSHIRVPTALDMHHLVKHRGGATRWFFDLGAGLYNGGAPGVTNGGSLAWFSRRYAESDRDFDRVFAWEAEPHLPKQVWDTMPDWLVPRLSYFNTPVTADPSAAHHPVSTLDIDTPEVELALVRQLLADEQLLVDELYWEHHVSGSVACCPELWGGGAPPKGKGRAWALMKFNTSDPHQTLLGS